MEIIDSRTEVSFRVRFTAEEVATLKRAADAHYDAVCRSFQPLTLLAVYILHGIELEALLSWRDLDILSKICESPLVPDHTSQKVWKVFAELRRCTELAGRSFRIIANGTLDTRTEAR